MQSRFTQPAIVGGLVVGVLSALPLVSAGNICCCLWVVLGGVTAAYLLQQNQPGPITAGDGALAGLIAGAIGAGIYLVLSIPVTLFVAPFERALFERMSQGGDSMPPELRGIMDGPAGAAIRLMLGFVFMLFAGPVFATLGGLLGAALFRKAPSAGRPGGGGPAGPGTIDAEIVPPSEG